MWIGEDGQDGIVDAEELLAAGGDGSVGRRHGVAVRAGRQKRDLAAKGGDVLLEAGSVLLELGHGLAARGVGGEEGVELLAEGHSVEDFVAERGRVEGEGVAGFEIDETGDRLRVIRADPAHLLARQGVPDDDGMIDPERGHDGEHVACPDALRGVVAGDVGGMAGGAKAATSERVDVIVRDELRCEGLEDVSVVAGSGEEDEGTTGPAPIESFDLRTSCSTGMSCARGTLRGVLPCACAETARYG